MKNRSRNAKRGALGDDALPLPYKSNEQLYARGGGASGPFAA
jgi:hypothetical protein